MIIHPQYEGFYGSVGRIGKSSVQTLFFQVLGFPIFPKESYWVTGSALVSWSNVQVMELRRSGPSILAGYLRGWSTMGALWALAASILFAFLPGQALWDGDPMPFGRSVIVPIGLALGLALAILALGIFLMTRKPIDRDEAARRAVFEELLGTAVDPALLVDPWSQRDDLKRGMAEIAEAEGLGRSTALFSNWREIAISFPSPMYLRMALTVARLSRAAPEDGKRSDELPALEDRIWGRLVAMEPSVASRAPSGE